MKTLLSVNNISYQINGKKILSDISLSAGAGEIIGISGLSGSGKTTLAKIIAQIILPSQGNIDLLTKPRNKGAAVQLLFQNSVDIINPLRTVWDMVHELTGINNKRTLKSRQTEITQTYLKEACVNSELWNRKGYELSGGEQQRAAIARIFASMPEIYVFDEPFSAQDPEVMPLLIKSIKEKAEASNFTFICISHDINTLKKFCTRYIILHNGVIEDSGEMNNIDNSANEITKFLLKAQNYKLTPEDFQF